MNTEQEQIIKKFEEIDHKNGLILIDYIINNKYDINFIKNILESLAKNKNKHIYEIYDYIIKNTEINFDTLLTPLDIYNVYFRDDFDDIFLTFIGLCTLYWNINLLNDLIKNGIDINLRDYNGRTSLMLASGYTNFTSSNETVKLLLENGADINAQNKFGNTALMIASNHSNNTSSNETIKLLIDNGADINIKNNDGYTALMLSLLNINLINSHCETIKILLDNGADINIKNKDGNTALIVAFVDTGLLIYGYEKYIKLLLEYGADPNIKNNEGKTAYDYAELEEHKNLIKSYMNQI